MNFNPYTETLSTSTGRLIKRLHCPYRLSAEDLDPQDRCRQCSKTILDAHSLPEEKLADLLQVQPDTCLKVNLNHPDITFTHERI